jgi:glyoxylase-like metal-dependent hydrolase (beta-lactamase superfamily II)
MDEPLPSAVKTAKTAPEVEAFFDAATSTLTYVVTSPGTRRCTIIDPVLDYDESWAAVSTLSADTVVRYVRENGLTVDYILETHVHADHLSGAHYLRQHLGGLVAIGAAITEVQSAVAEIYAELSAFARDGSQFDVLLDDERRLAFGSVDIRVLHVPGHTPACVAYLIGDALFAGDTLFMPDTGTARCDFPGGDARNLYRSIQRLLTLPDTTRVFVCHDYQPNGRPLQYVASIKMHRDHNVHVNQTVSETTFVTLRCQRDAGLAPPTLMLPSLQVNVRGGTLPRHPLTGEPVFTYPLTR